MRQRIGGRVVTPTGIVPGRVEIDGDTITAVTAAGADVPDHWVVPGFVDLHNHGGGGHDFATGDGGAAAAFHLAHGTTTLLASLVSGPHDATLAATAELAPLVGRGVLAGVHLEGPYLSAARCGAQHPGHLRDPDPDELAELLGTGVVRMVTLAPELAGAEAAIRQVAAAGAVAALGHTAATYQQTVAGIAAGAAVATHLFNGMPPVHHRDPGPVPALLDSPAMVCELIADGVHLHDAVLAFAARHAGPERVALVTDAIAAAGRPDGRYELGGQPVVVAGGVARLARDGSLAGSTLTMDAALRRAVGAGIPLVDAVRMAATTPARVLGLADRTGSLAAGLRADLVVLDAGLRVLRVLRAGTPVPA